MDNREQARGWDTSSMGTARVKQEKEAYTRMTVKEYYEIKERGYNKGKVSKQDKTRSKDLTTPRGTLSPLTIDQTT